MTHEEKLKELCRNPQIGDSWIVGITTRRIISLIPFKILEHGAKSIHEYIAFHKWCITDISLVSRECSCKTFACCKSCPCANGAMSGVCLRCWITQIKQEIKVMEDYLNKK